MSSPAKGQVTFIKENRNNMGNREYRIVFKNSTDRNINSMRVSLRDAPGGSSGLSTSVGRMSHNGGTQSTQWRRGEGGDPTIEKIDWAT